MDRTLAADGSEGDRPLRGGRRVLAAFRHDVPQPHNVMVQITLTLPQDIAEDLVSKWADLPRAVLESLALEGYRAGALTQAQVRRLLGFASLAEVDGFLKEHGVYLEYTLDDLERDIANNRLITR